MTTRLRSRSRAERVGQAENTLGINYLRLMTIHYVKYESSGRSISHVGPTRRHSLNWAPSDSLRS